MRKLFMILGLLFALTADAQVPGIYTPAVQPQYGANNHRLRTDSVFLFPTGCGTPNSLKWHSNDSLLAAKYYDSCNAKEYTWNPKLRLWIQSISAADLALKLNISDTASMLSNLRRSSTLILNADILSLAWSKITGTPTTKSGYGITDVMAYADSAAMLAAYTHMGNTFNGNNQLLQLDAAGKVPFTNLPAALMIYKGTWAASTNTPILANGSGTSGWVYKVTDYGIVDFGAGVDTFYVGDYVIYNGSQWQRSADGDNVVSVSVNGSTPQQGIVSVTLPNTSVTNAMLANSSITIGSTSISLGATASSLAGLTNITATGTVSAGTFSGAGTNLTGTAGSLSIGGTAANATTWNSQAFSSSGSVITPYRFLIYDNSSSAWKPQDIAGTASILGAYAVWVDSTAGNTVVLNAGMALGGRNLSIKGTMNIGGDVLALGSVVIPNAQYYYSKNSGGTQKQVIGINGSNKVSIDADGLGSVLGGIVTVASQINFTNSGTNISGNGSSLIEQAGTEVLWYVNGAYRGTISSGGIWGIGTTTPSSVNAGGYNNTLVVSSTGNFNGITIEQTSTQVSSLRFGDGGSSRWDQGSINYDHSTDALTFASNRTLALTIASNQAITAVSSITATAFYESSDERLKNIFDRSISRDGISTIHYTLKKSGQERYGYTAQNVQAILPFAVTTGEDGFLKVDYTSVFTYKIMLLEQRIAQLEKQSL